MMSRQSNEFQRLVKSIYENLYQKDVKITESAEICERNGTCPREIDILIEKEVAGEVLRIGIECRDRNQKDDITWIDGIVGKYLNMDLHKKIAVSSEGFTKSAIEKAKANGISIYTLKEATEANWEGEFFKLGIASISLKIDFAKYRVKVGNEIFEMEQIKGKHITLLDGSTRTFDQVLFQLYTQVVSKKIEAKFRNDLLKMYTTVADLSKMAIFEATETIPSLTVKNEDGSESKCEATFLAVGIPTVSKADLSHHVLDEKGIHISDGTMEVEGEKFKINAIQDGTDKIQWKMSKIE